MKSVVIGRSSLKTSRMAYGGWRLAGTWDPKEVTPEGEARGRRAVRAALEAGFTCIDLADIYCLGVCEKIFGDVLRESPGLRESLTVVTKCGIRPANQPVGTPCRYDFSAAHIEASCEASLRRLGVETIDLYLLHRPDYLMDPAEVAEAFGRLQAAGKVREFGVSNFRPSQVRALQRTCPMPLVVNQVEISLVHQNRLEDGTLDHCLEDGITPMGWSPLAGGMLGDGHRRVLPSQEAYVTAEINRTLDELAAERGCSRIQLALAWLLKHPAGIVPIVGSTDPGRIAAAAGADAVTISREDWYGLLSSGRDTPLP